MKEDYEFEWDEAKAMSNAHKHGVSFEEAMAIWDDPMFAEVHLQSDPEDRWAVIGQIAKDMFLTAIITYRYDRVRIISARKSTKKETDVHGKN